MAVSIDAMIRSSEAHFIGQYGPTAHLLKNLTDCSYLVFKGHNAPDRVEREELVEARAHGELK